MSNEPEWSFLSAAIPLHSVLSLMIHRFCLIKPSVKIAFLKSCQCLSPTSNFADNHTPKYMIESSN